MTTTAIVLTVLGLLVGSFLGLVSVRLPLGGRIVAGRSRCNGCGRSLGPLDLIPLLSFARSRGCCRTCGAAIPRRYPLMEAGAAIIGLWAGLSQPAMLPAALTALLGWQLLLISVVDAENFWLPDALTLPLAAAGFAAAGLLNPHALIASATGTVAGYVALQAIRLGYRALRGREGMGGGDPILFAAAGAWVGWPGLPSVLLWAAAAGLSVVAAIWLIRRSLAAADRLPFGVFLCIGLWMVWLFGPFGG